MRLYIIMRMHTSKLYMYKESMIVFYSVFIQKITKTKYGCAPENVLTYTYITIAMESYLLKSLITYSLRECLYSDGLKREKRHARYGFIISCVVALCVCASVCPCVRACVSVCVWTWLTMLSALLYLIQFSFEPGFNLIC